MADRGSKTTGAGDAGTKGRAAKTKRSGAAARATPAAKPAQTAGPAVSAEQRRAMIAECAYLRAERRGFIGGDPVVDWLEGEKEIDRLLGQRTH